MTILATIAGKLLLFCQCCWHNPTLSCAPPPVGAADCQERAERFGLQSVPAPLGLHQTSTGRFGARPQDRQSRLPMDCSAAATRSAEAEFHPGTENSGTAGSMPNAYEFDSTQNCRGKPAAEGPGRREYKAGIRGDRRNGGFRACDVARDDRGQYRSNAAG